MLGAKLVLLVLFGQTSDLPREPAALVEKLGSARYAEREATKSLEGLGSKALPALRSALKASDPEVRLRARALINKIEGNLLLQETKVRLDFQDATPEEIARSLSKQAGFEVRIGVGRPNAERQRVTLRAPAPVSFWKAIDRLCEATGLSYEEQNVSLPGQMQGQPAIVLSYQGDPLNRPSYVHGPFCVNVVALNYHSQISFYTSTRRFAQLRAAGGNVPGLARVARRPAGPMGAGAAEPNRPVGTDKAASEPLRHVQFTAQLQILIEPRMALSLAGPLQVTEAVDDLGNSLLPRASDEETPALVRGERAQMMAFSTIARPGGLVTSSVAELHRPEKAGKLIRKLRGTVPVSVVARRPNPLVIALQGAVGKTFQNDQLHVVVNSIDTDQPRPQDVIELTIENLDELYPEDAVSGMGPMAVPGRFGRMATLLSGPDAGQLPIQLIDSRGQNTFFSSTIERDSGRVTLRVPRMPQRAEPREIRVSSVVRASANIPFEFKDLPMP